MHAFAGGQSSPALLLWDGVGVRGFAHASDLTGSLPPPTLCAGWKGVWTWAVHENDARVGLQWAISDEGRLFRRSAQPPRAIRVLTSHAWIHNDDAGRVYTLDEPVE